MRKVGDTSGYGTLYRDLHPASSLRQTLAARSGCGQAAISMRRSCGSSRSLTPVDIDTEEQA